MKQLIISTLFILGFGSYAVYVHSASKAQAAPNSLSIATTTETSAVVSIPPEKKTTPIPVPTPVPTPPVTVPVQKPRSGQYVDGTYTGRAADAYYGYIQVRATISGGKLTNVAFLQYPNDRSTSRYINEQAMPMLRAEALQAQSAKVDGVSGASDSSQAFVESLSSALAQARA